MIGMVDQAGAPQRGKNPQPPAEIAASAAAGERIQPRGDVAQRLQLRCARRRGVSALRDHGASETVVKTAGVACAALIAEV